MSVLSFDAYGVPETQGSSRAFVRGGRAVVTSDNPKLRPWRDTVTWAARDALGIASSWSPLQGAASVEITFWMPRPKSAPRTVDVYPVKGKDLDKMIRSILDSCTNAGVWGDDSQVVDVVARKRYAVGPHLPKIYTPEIHWVMPGAHVTVSEL